MKTVKRIIAVFLLVLAVAVIGYLVYTGSRLADLQDERTTKTEVVYVQEENF